MLIDPGQMCHKGIRNIGRPVQEKGTQILATPPYIEHYNITFKIYTVCTHLTFDKISVNFQYTL